MVGTALHAPIQQRRGRDLKLSLTIGVQIPQPPKLQRSELLPNPHPPLAAPRTAPATSAACQELDQAMRALVAGDNEAFSRIYRAVEPSVRKLLLQLGADTMTAEDLTHDAILRLYQARSRYRAGANVFGWARTIARRLYIDRVRDRRKARVAFDGLGEYLGTPMHCRPPEDLLQLKHRAQSFNAAFARLPQQQAQAFRVVDIDGTKLDDASKMLAASNLSVRLRAFRARQTLRKALAPVSVECV